MMMYSPTPVPTEILVRVIANDGKFLGDDIGGAAITVRDAQTQEILAQGVTSGDSGPNGKAGPAGQAGVMCVALKRGEALPTGTAARPDTAAKFAVTLALSAPRRIKVSAFGPLAARGSANTASATTWLFPGKHLTAGNALLLELPGLICQIVAPPAHTTNLPGPEIPIVANVAMMCGCPIGLKEADAICPGPADAQPWLPQDFDVFAVSPQCPGERTRLCWDAAAGVAGRFVGNMAVPGPGTYQLTVCAHQKTTGNTGVDFSTFIISPPS